MRKIAKAVPKEDHLFVRMDANIHTRMNAKSGGGKTLQGSGTKYKNVSTDKVHTCFELRSQNCFCFKHVRRTLRSPGEFVNSCKQVIRFPEGK